MKRLPNQLFLLSVLLWVSCGGSPGSSGSSDPSAPETELSAETPATRITQIPFDAGAVYLERMYATSTGRFGPENVLDGDPGTEWEAMPGAGLNEGIMLYFGEPLRVARLRILTGAKSGAKRFEVFANGGLVGSAEPGKDVPLDEDLRSLFIRVDQMEGEERPGYFIKYGHGEISRHPDGQLVSVSELELYGADGNRLKVRPLHLESGRATASSTLEPAEAYSPDFLFDSRKEFGWAEGVESSGEGEEIKFTFDKALTISGIRIHNGYQRSESHFTGNARAREIGFGLEGGEQFSFTLADKQDGQTLDLPRPLIGNSFVLKIKSVYPGAKYKDLVLSEMRFFDGQRWFAMYSPEVEARKKTLKGKVAGTSLEKVTDRSLYDQWVKDNMGSHRRSLLLRSNGSFVLYLSDSERETDSKSREIRQVADGNWEIVEAGKDKSRIKIFGKIHRIRDKVDLYKGTSSSESTRIFHEFLSIDREWVRGEKLVDSIRTRLLDGDLVGCGAYTELRTDLRYATDNNFMKTYLYSECLPCMLRNDAAKALGKAQKLLDEKSGGEYTFLVWDGYRPYEVQKLMWEKIKDPKYVADPYNGGSSHNKGAAVDLSLIPKSARDLQSIPMGTDFDFFGEKAHHGAAGLTEEESKNRKLLREVMEGAGFKALETEWWHYNFEAPGLRIIDVNQECDY